jgi:hypothetical protein
MLQTSIFRNNNNNKNNNNNIIIIIIIIIMQIYLWKKSCRHANICRVRKKIVKSLKI